MLLKTTTLICVLVATTSFANIQVTPQSGERLVPTSEHIITTANVLDQLSQTHFRRQKLNDSVSSKVFDRYLEVLDPNRSYFTSADVDEFSAHRFKIDDYLKSGNLIPAFNMYNRSQIRIIERLEYILDLTENKLDTLDFKQIEELELNREDSTWPKNRQELDDLWRKRLKDTVLNLKLSEKSMKDIKETLVKRYNAQLQRTRKANNEDAFQTYINALTHTYDPHTQYFSPQSSENFNINMSLSLEGIGAVLQTEDEYTSIVRLVPAGPADKSGLLKPSDKIVAVSQGKKGKWVDIVGWRLDEVVQLIRGPKDSIVRLEVQPGSGTPSDRKVIQLVRNKVKLEEQSAQKKVLEVEQNGAKFKVGIIDIPTFYVDFQAQQENQPDYKSTARDVERILNELKAEGVDGVVVDLRNNGGGSLYEANKLIGLFIKSGPTVQVKSTNGRIDILSDPDPSVTYSGPMAVLVNRLSASASEIFAGAIQDFQRGIVIGGQTFGKGTVQSLRPLNRGQLKITQAKFYRISGESTQHQGIIPDISYPPIYDHDKIGESTEEEALPWDSIGPANYNLYGNMTPLVSDLQTKHENRIQADPDFQYLIQQIDLLKEIDQRKSITLNEQLRRKEHDDTEKKRLDIENVRLKAKGEPILKSLVDKDKEEEDAAAEDGPEEEQSPTEDALLVESANILMDMIKLSQQYAAAARN